MTHKPSKKKNLFLISTSRITNGRRCSGGLRLFKPNFPPSFARALLHVIIRSHEGPKIELVRVTVLIAQEVATTSRCIKAFGRSTIQKPVEPCPDVGRLRISELGQTSLLKIFKPIYCSKLLANRFDDEVVHLAIGRRRQGVDDGIGAVGRCQSRPGFPLFQRLLVEINITSFIDFRSYNSRTDAPKSTY
jgi:hypothetical protein